MLKKLYVQTSHYTLSSALSALSGTISFPFLTRMLTVGEYGLLSLVSTTLELLVGVGKMGTQHSIVRFHGEADAGKGPADLKGFYSTAILTMAATGLAGTALWAVVSPHLSAAWFRDSRIPGLFLLTAILIAVRVTGSALSNLLRAEQRTKALMVYRVMSRYVTLGFIVVALLFVARSVFGFYLALIVGELLLLGVLAVYVFVVLRRPTPSPRHFSPALLRQMVAYGVPMMIGYELAGVILNVGDRYVIEALLGTGPLGLYSAAYNMCDYVRSIFILSIAQAVVPIYMRMWAEEGPEATGSFLEQSLRQYALLAAPVMAGVAAVGSDLLPFLASEKYASGAVVLPSVIAGMVFSGATAFTGAGLFLHRKTVTIMTLVVAAAALNVGLNLALIPRIGILGAALATLLSYAGLLVATTAFAQRELAVTLPWGALVKAGVLALGMYVVVVQIDAGGRLVTLVARVAAGVALYGGALLAVDRPIREQAQRVLAQLRSRPGT
ncbi:MAG: flippase [Acidobacteria bacterium]|jgi:O-antigen/teichoic acid export membrane protein|nr:flippase [Acidobacteriota bacterium]